MQNNTALTIAFIATLAASVRKDWGEMQEWLADFEEDELGDDYEEVPEENWGHVWAGLVKELAQFSPDDLYSALKDEGPLHEAVASMHWREFQVPGTGPWLNLLRPSQQKSENHTCSVCEVTRNPLIDKEFERFHFLPEFVGGGERRVYCSTACIEHDLPHYKELLGQHTGNPRYRNHPPKGCHVCGKDDQTVNGFLCSEDCLRTYILTDGAQRSVHRDEIWLYRLNLDAKGYWRKQLPEHMRCEHCGLLLRSEFKGGGTNHGNVHQLRLDAHMCVTGDDAENRDHTLDGHAKKERPFCTPQCALAWLTDHHGELFRVQLKDIPEGAHELFLCGNPAPDGYLAAYGPSESTLFQELFYDHGAGGCWASESWPTYYATVGGLRVALLREKHRLSEQNVLRPSPVGSWYLPDKHEVANAITDWYQRYFPRR